MITFGEEEMGGGSEWDIFLSKENMKRNMKRTLSALEIGRIQYKVALTL